MSTDDAVQMMSCQKIDEKSDVKKLYFPEGALLNQVEVAVVEAERRKTEYLKDPYTVYLVESRPLEDSIGFDHGCALWRRYSEFELLHNYLITMYPYIVMPPLPEKRINVAKLQLATDKFDPNFIERRRQGLECFLLRLASHPVFSQDPIFKGFFNQHNGWKESVDASQWKQKVDNRFKSLSASMAVKKPDQRFNEIWSYCDSLNVNIAAVLKVQQRIYNKTSSTIKLHYDYGKLFREWSAIESENGDLLQKVGERLDGLASQTKVILNEEEVAYIDQLKEYLFFTDSLKAIIRKQNLKQWDLEKAEEHLSVKSRQKEELIWDIQRLDTGKGLPPPTGLKSVHAKIFGVETLEVKQDRLLTLEGQVKDAETSVAIVEEDTNVFIEKSLKDFERFEKQKVRDLNEIMKNYIKTQVVVNKLGLQQWQAIKEYFSKM